MWLPVSRDRRLFPGRLWLLRTSVSSSSGSRVGRDREWTPGAFTPPDDLWPSAEPHHHPSPHHVPVVSWRWPASCRLWTVESSSFLSLDFLTASSSVVIDVSVPSFLLKLLMKTNKTEWRTVSCRVTTQSFLSDQPYSLLVKSKLKLRPLAASDRLSLEQTSWVRHKSHTTGNIV